MVAARITRDLSPVAAPSARKRAVLHCLYTMPAGQGRGVMQLYGEATSLLGHPRRDGALSRLLILPFAAWSGSLACLPFTGLLSADRAPVVRRGGGRGRASPPGAAERGRKRGSFAGFDFLGTPTSRSPSSSRRPTIGTVEYLRWIFSEDKTPYVSLFNLRVRTGTLCLPLFRCGDRGPRPRRPRRRPSRQVAVGEVAPPFGADSFIAWNDGQPDFRRRSPISWAAVIMAPLGSFFAARKAGWPCFPFFTGEET